MKRGGPIKRRVSLQAKTPLSRVRFASNRKQPLAPRRPKVTQEERKARKLLRGRSNGLCEMDGRSRATDAQHRKNRSQGGLWAVENLLHVCRACHQHIHANPTAAMEQGWTVPSHRDPAGVPVWLAGREFVFLNADGSITEIEEEEAA